MAKNSLKKSVLLKVPLQMASAHTISQAKRHETDYYMKAAVRLIDHKRILVLHVYHKEDLQQGRREPRFRTFLTKTDYISRYYEDGGFKWRTGRLEALVEYQYYDCKKPVFCD